MKLIKVARVGNKVMQVAISDTADVNAALIAAGMQPFANEDIWLNHQVVAKSVGLRDGDTIILEPKATKPVSQGMKNLIDFLMDEDVFDHYDYEDDDENVDYNEALNDNKDFIDSLIRKAKEA